MGDDVTDMRVSREGRRMSRRWMSGDANVKCGQRMETRVEGDDEEHVERPD